MPSIPGLENVNWFPMVAKSMYWLGYSLLGFAILGVMYVAYYLTEFKIKLTVLPMYGSGKDGVFSVGKPKSNSVKWIKNRTAWKPLKPFFNKREIEPFDSEYILPGKKAFAFELNDVWIPGRVNIDSTENNLRAEINPIPYFVRNWQSMEHKRNAEEFAKDSFWDKNKNMILTLGTVLFCLALCGATIYFTYKFSTPYAAKMDLLRNAINNIGQIPGTPPG